MVRDASPASRWLARVASDARERSRARAARCCALAPLTLLLLVLMSLLPTAAAAMTTQTLTRATPVGSDYCGQDVESADFNADGRDDTVAGCYGADPGGVSSAGMAVVHLRNSANSGFDAGVELTRASPAASDQCGGDRNIAVGDVNGDGRADVVMGCYAADPSGLTSAGLAVVFTRNAGNTGFDAGVELVAPSAAASDFCGDAVATGDVNGDGRDDVIVGCRGRDPGGVTSAGASIVFTRNSGNTGFDAGVQLVASSTASSDFCGNSVASADLNGDLRDDVVMGCNGRDPSGLLSAGAAVVFTRNTGNSGFDAGVELVRTAPAAYDYCGYAVGTGDVNADGRADVLVGCYGASPGGVSSAGIVVVAVRDIGNTGFVMESEVTRAAPEASDFCGRAVSTGDVTGDGRVDVITGCYGADIAGEATSGMVLGIQRNSANSGFVAGVMLAAPSPWMGDQCGYGVAAGNVDGSADATDELIAGCPGGDPNGATSSGMVIVGTPDVVAPQVPALVSPADGSAVDVNPILTATYADNAPASDGWLDFQVCSDSACTTVVASGSSGLVSSGTDGSWLAVLTDGTYYWRARSHDLGDNMSAWSATRTFALVHATQAISAPTPVDYDYCGETVASGDVNGDGRADVVFGCYGGDAAGVASSGYLFVATRNSANSGYDTPVMLYRSPPENSNLCPRYQALASGDVNGDGRDDVISGCYNATSAGIGGAGVVLVFIRNAANSGFDTPIELARASPVNMDNCGAAVAAGDVNGDLRDDVVMGCEGMDIGASAAGGAVVFTRNSGNTGFDAPVDVTAATPVANNRCGGGIDSGDVDGDGREDLLMGCWGADPSGLSNAGGFTVLVRDGTNSGFVAQDISPSPAEAGAACGVSVAVGDVNADARADLLVGCPSRDASGRSAAGAGLVLTRNVGNTGFDGAVEVTRSTPTASDSCGREVEVADANGDGRGDLLLGCDSADLGGTSNVGAVTVLMRDSANAGYQTSQDATRHDVVGGGLCGDGTGAGDTNGDGRAEVIVGCNQANVGGRTQSGGVWVVPFGAAATSAPPNAPTSLTQLRSDGATTIASGSWTTDGASTNVVLRLQMSDPDASETLTPWVEYRSLGTAFSGTCGTAVSGAVVSGGSVAAATAGAAVTGSVSVTGLASGSQYVWRACVVDLGGKASGWTAMGGNPDFGVDNIAPSAAPALVSPADAASLTSTPALTATYADVAPGSPGRVEFQLCSDSACTSVLQSGTSSGGLSSGTNGSWTPAALANGTYYWRARSVDGASSAGPWAASRSFTVGSSVTVSVDASSVSLSPAQVLGGQDAVASSSVTVGTSSASGYTLSARDGSDINGAECACGGAVPDWTGANATPTTWSAGTSGYWGITIRDATGGRLAKWGTGTGTAETDFTNNAFAGLKTTSDTVLHSRASSTAGDVVVATLRGNPSASTLPGSYSATVTYTVTANP